MSQPSVEIARAGAAQPGQWPASRLSFIHSAALRLISAQTRAAVADALLPACIGVTGATCAVLAVAAHPADSHDAAGPSLTLAGAVGASPELLAALEHGPDLPAPLAAALTEQEPQWLGSRGEVVARYPALAPALRDGAPQAWAFLPLRVEGRALGVLAVGHATEQAFGAEQQVGLAIMAAQAVMALDRLDQAEAMRHAARYEAVEQARAAAEEAVERTTQLYAVTAALAEALTLTEVADVIVSQGMAALGAIAGSVRQMSPEGDALMTLQVVGYPDALKDQWQNIPLDAQVPMAEAARTARHILIESPEELSSSWPQFVEAFTALRYQAVALLPLMAAGHVIGTMSFGFAAPRVFDADDRGFLDALARQCAVALERARLYAATQTQAARLGALAEASQLFAAASLDLASVLDTIAWRVAAAVGDLGVVGLLSDDRQTLRVAALAHANPEAQEVMGELLRSFPLGADEGISSKTLQSGEAQLLPELSGEQLRALLKPEYWPYLERFGIYSLMVAPLRVNGEVIGTLGALRDRPGRPYSGSDLTMLQELADRAALAVANARHYQQAREAIQVRDQFLSIAAHELKTPLTALSGQAQLAQRRLARGEQSPERLARSITMIARQADRLDAMVRMLLDVGRIERGQFALERQPFDLVALIERVLDEVRPDLERHTLRYEPGAAALIIDGDPLRLEQVFQNLVSNAVKYSPHGGTITVRVARTDGRAMVMVSDEGVGIPAEALPQLFQRFFRAPNVAAHRISGMGIGLYVVREIVARHGGTVDVTSSEGVGSTFTVGLPALTDDEAGGI